MNCQQHIDALGEYMDGTLDADARARLERHLAGCEQCRRTADDLARIREMAATLPERTPPDRVWVRVANELERQAGTGTPARRGWFAWAQTRMAAPRPGATRRLVPLAAAAVVLLGAAVGYFAFTRGAPAPGRTASAGAGGAPGGTVVRASDDDLVRSVQEELTLAESHYDKAIAGLEQIARAGQGTLDPQVAATLQKNLAVIDQAIADSRLALKSQPTSQLAQESLFEAFRRKVALLQDTVALINEMRKGNEAGAAKIIGNLNKS
jgi:anti-sigma factor RsiW